MSNLESSWEETIVQLAQAGNLRAVAFWLNRALVVQGICVQATTNQPGQLTLQVLCRQTPDRDRLVQFIGDQLAKLNSPVIRSVQMRTQLMGASNLLWSQTVELVPASSAAISQGYERRYPVAEPAEAESGKTAQDAHHFAVSQKSDRTSQINSMQVNSVANHAASDIASDIASNIALADPSSVTEPLAVEEPPVAEKPPVPPASPTTIRVPIAFQPAPSSAQPRSKSGASKPQSFKRKTIHWLKQSQQQMQHSSRQLRQSTEQSIRWFQRRKPRQKTVILGGCAIAAFLLGSGFELLRYQATLMTARSQNPEAAAGASYQGMVKAAIEQVPVIQLPAANPDSSAITLLFSNAVTLTPVAGQSGIAAQQKADMVTTSLNAPLGLTATSLSSSNAASPVLSPEAASPGEGLENSAQGSGSSPESSSPESIASQAPETSAANADAAEASPSPANPSEGFSEDSSETDLSETSSDPARDSASELPPVNLPPVTLQQLQANGVNVVNLASNQLMQGSGDALTQTIKSLSQASIYPIGAGTNDQSARRPQIFSIKGKRIAYLGYSDVGLQSAGKETAGLNSSVNAQVEADIKAIRAQVDWVIVSYHWNQNLRSYPEDWQVSLTHAAIDHGADLVVGYHPTVTQGAEVYGGRAIVYSLGSMLDPYSQDSTANQPATTYETFALKLQLQDQQMQVELLPVRVSDGKTEILTPETGASILDYLKQASSLFRQPLRSPTLLDAKIRITLPAAPNSDKPFSEPFTTDPTP